MFKLQKCALKPLYQGQSIDFTLHDGIQLSEEKVSFLSLLIPVLRQIPVRVIKVDCETHLHIVEGQATGIYLN